MAEHEVWLVTIELPIKYINRGLERIDDIIQKDIESTNAEIADAYGEEMPPENDMDVGDMPSEEEIGDMPPENDMPGGNV